MKLNDYPWLISSYQHLVTPILQNRAHHALLISYVQGSGENELIKTLANRLLCQASNQTEPCFQCHSCKLFLADNHPDYSVITNDQGKQSIGVDKIRTMASNVYEKPQQGGNKVIWIKHAALMTDAAANALLKTLEEPPGNTYFILSDDHNSKFLPTIYSRCFAYFLTVPALERSIEWLKQKHQQYSDNELAAALLLNESAPLAAIAILEPEKWQQRKNFYEKLLNILPQNDYWSLAKTIDYEQFIERINWFCTLLSDALKAKQKAGRFIVNRDHVSLVRLLANYDSEKITQLYDLWLQTREQLLTITGINKELIAYNLLAQSELIK